MVLKLGLLPHNFKIQCESFCIFCLQEAAWECASTLVDYNWPAEGRVEFLDYGLRYRSGLDLVLKGISFGVHGGEKVS